MLPVTSPRKKYRSPVQDVAVNTKTSVTCSNVPESLFDATTAKKHFSKFGRVQKIRLFPKRQMCIIEYDQPTSLEHAVLNAGAFDGFMFDVTRTKARVRRRSKKDDDPDWLPDSDVEEELSAMGGNPIYRTPRQKAMDVEDGMNKPTTLKRVIKQTVAQPLRKKVPVREKPIIPSQTISGIDTPVLVATTQNSLSTTEAAAELIQLRLKVSLTPDEQWRTLDARDRILRAWGGAGSRVKVGGATIGTCPDMCPEKELLHRQSEYQVMTLETAPGSEGQLEPCRAVKQYSRSSADQEIPMCFELRPAPVLMRTCAYLLHEIADTTRHVSLADWFHFMWDRLRGIRKDITQQALCCAESICLVEMCARFHAHCAARLADLENTQFDQKLNTDNLTKCLQTLKHMYADVEPEQKPREAEFRGYIALLNLGDANFWWEIKQLPLEIQKSEPITVAMNIYNALDNNNYVRFFRLIQEKATYLQACILLRYFNDVRARALARIVKAFAPRGGSRYPAEDLMRALAFESVETMNSFINHYGLRCAKVDDIEPTIILDRNQFIEDSDPYPMAREVDLIESKRNSTVGELIAGGKLPKADFSNHILYSSFNKDGRLKESALTAEDQGYNTINDSNKDLQGLKAETQKLLSGKTYVNTDMFSDPRSLIRPDPKSLKSKSVPTVVPKDSGNKLFSFKPAIPVAPTEEIENSPEVLFDGNSKSIFSFSKPQESLVTNNFFAEKTTESVFVPPAGKLLFNSKPLPKENVFGPPAGKGLFESKQLPKENIFALSTGKGLFESKQAPKENVFAPSAGRSLFESKPLPKENVFAPSAGNDLLVSKQLPNENIFVSSAGKGLFESKQSTKENVFAPPAGKGLFESKQSPKENVFAPPAGKGLFESKQSPIENVFAPPAGKFMFDSKPLPSNQNVFGKSNNDPFDINQNQFKSTKSDKSVFDQANENKQGDTYKNSFGNYTNTNLFAKKEEENTQGKTKNIFSNANIFSKPDCEGKVDNIFSKPAVEEEKHTTRPNNIFGSFNKPLETSHSIFNKPDTVDGQIKPFSTPNGEATDVKISPGSFFKSVINPSNGSNNQEHSIFQSKNKAQSVADNILDSINVPKNDTVYDFVQNEDHLQDQLIEQQLLKERINEEERKLQEKIRIEEERNASLRRQEEERRKEEALKRQEELKQLEKKLKKEEERKQEELRRKLEEEKKAELKRKLEEEERKFKEKVNKQSAEIIEELTDEIAAETASDITKEEVESLQSLVKYASEITEEILADLSNEMCCSEMKAEKFWTEKLMRNWYHVWRKQYIRNVKRRNLLEDTPVWLTENTPVEEAEQLRRLVENATLKNMNAFHRGYKFKGELRQFPSPEPYNIMELIRSPLLKRMKQINYPYDKCFFWKVTLVSPGAMKWLYRKIDIEKWLLSAFSDKKKHEASESLIRVEKQSWNHLMDFAISVSLTNKERISDCGEAIEGANGFLFYAIEDDHTIILTIKETLKQKYPYQILPVTVLLPDDASINNTVDNLLKEYVKNNCISAYKIYTLDSKNILESLNVSTKSAVKWMARKYPQNPPIEIDYLKSICQRYLGNEIWCRFKTVSDGRMHCILKDLNKLVKCYNTAVDKLTEAITDEDLFNYSSFPLEFKTYLDNSSPHPKPFEFIPSSVRNAENISAIKDIMLQLKLPKPSMEFNPLSVENMQQQMRCYCNQIGWFKNPEEVVCRVVALLPNELSDVSMSCEDFSKYLAHYDLTHFLNVIIYEKINRLNNFDNRFAVYKRSVIEEYRNINWLYETNVLCEMKHKALQYEDDLDIIIQAKRRKIAMDSMEYLMLENKDCSLVEDNIKATDMSISLYNECNDSIEQIEKQIEEERIKSIEFENMLRVALSEV